MKNGTVLPSGLLGAQGAQTSMASFNRSFRNTGIKAGIIINSYAATDPKNISKLCTEYDVLTMEQLENKGSTPITYKNCLSSQGLGSIADYFEFTLRFKTFQTNKGFPTFSGQDGAVVLIQCLDNVGDKAIVIGSLIHPDRPTTISNTDPHLAGEYNGVQIGINADGSTSLNFQGATDSKGNVIDPSQGLTSINIDVDGSFQIKHSTVTLRLDKSGTVSLKALKDLEMAITGNVSITLNGDATINAQGKCDIISSGKTTITASEIDLNGSTGKVLTTSTDPVVDTIYGTPTMGVPTVKSG